MTKLILHNRSNIFLYDYGIASEEKIDFEAQAEEFLDMICNNLPYITLKLLVGRVAKRIGCEPDKLLEAILAEGGICND